MWVVKMLLHFWVADNIWHPKLFYSTLSHQLSPLLRSSEPRHLEIVKNRLFSVVKTWKLFFLAKTKMNVLVNLLSNIYPKFSQIGDKKVFSPQGGPSCETRFWPKINIYCATKKLTNKKFWDKQFLEPFRIAHLSALSRKNLTNPPARGRSKHVWPPKNR